MEAQIEFCKHVYKDVGADICPFCGRDIRRTNWQEIARQRREHREKHGLFYNVREWWSI